MAQIVMTRAKAARLVVQAVTADGEPLDLTGATLRFVAKRAYSDPDADAVLNKTTPTDITIIDSAGGVAEVKIEEADTNIDSISARSGAALLYELYRVQGGDSEILASGVLIIRPTVLHATV